MGGPPAWTTPGSDTPARQSRLACKSHAWRPPCPAAPHSRSGFSRRANGCVCSVVRDRWQETTDGRWCAQSRTWVCRGEGVTTDAFERG